MARNRKELLKAADSYDAPTRLRAGLELAASAELDDDEVASAIGYLLVDPHNVAPAHHIPRLLLGRNDRFAAWIIFSAIGIADEQHNSYLLTEVYAAHMRGEFDLPARLAEAAASDSPRTRWGCQVLTSGNRTGHSESHGVGDSPST
jgi:hypothetical protein